jgi:hypothetical protein
MSGHVLEQLSAYLDGELAGAQRAVVHEHLGACAACAQRLGELAALDELARALPAAAPPGYFEELPARVRARLQAQRRAPRIPVWSWAAAAALLLAVLTPAVLRRAPAPADAPARVQQLPAPSPAEPMGSPLQLEPKEESLERHQLPSRPMAKPVVPQASTVPPMVGALREAVPERRKQAGEEAGDGYAAAPPTTAPAAPAPVGTPPPLARTVPELDEAQRADEYAAGSRARDAERPRPETTDGGAPRRMATGAAAKLADRQTAADTRYRILLAAAAPQDAAAARSIREAWRAFVRDNPTHFGTDEARIRVVEAGLTAYRLGGDTRDLDSVRADANAYLARPDAAQPDRVRALLQQIDQQ